MKPYEQIDRRRSKLPELVASGIGAGEMAKALGVSYGTVLKDLRASGYVFEREGRGKGSWVPKCLVLPRCVDRREWSALDGRTWCCPRPTREEAIAEADAPSEVGRVEWFWPTVDAMAVIEYLEQAACDFAGDFGEEWLGDLSCDSPEVGELQAMLQAAFEKWMAKTNRRPILFQVHNIEPAGGEDPC